MAKKVKKQLKKLRLHALFCAHGNVHLSNGNLRIKNTTGIVIAAGKKTPTVRHTSPP